MTQQLVTAAWPRDLLTLADWEALDLDEHLRIECVEGVLFLAAHPFPRHQLVLGNLTAQLQQQLSDDLVSLGEVEVVLFEVPLTVRIPDVVVTPVATLAANPSRLTASDLALAVEVSSVGSQRVDRVMKMSEYADARIPHYWLIDLDPLTLSAYRLAAEGSYELDGTYRERASLQVAGVDVRLDVAALSRR